MHRRREKVQLDLENKKKPEGRRTLLKRTKEKRDRLYIEDKWSAAAYDDYKLNLDIMVSSGRVQGIINDSGAPKPFWDDKLTKTYGIEVMDQWELEVDPVKGQAGLGACDIDHQYLSGELKTWELEKPLTSNWSKESDV